MYRYFAWNSNGYLNGNTLMHVSKIQRILKISTKDCHVSIQHYDKEGNSLRCPIIFDIDQESLLDAYNIMLQIVEDIEWEYSVEPRVYYSGNRGFHVVIPFMIEHSRCHEIARSMATNISNDIDTQIYRRQGLIRIVNTLHPKSGLYKVEVTDSLHCLDNILQLAKTKQLAKNLTSVTSSELVECAERIADSLPDITNLESYPQYLTDLFSDMTPCLKALWNIDRLIEGHRHRSILILVSYFYTRGASKDRLIELFSSHALYRTIPKEYNKVINSMCSRPPLRDIGCRHGVHAEFLQSMCKSPCWFKDKYRDFIGANSEL